jgi:hypothetical protein
MARRALDPRTVARVVAAFGFEALRGRSGMGTGAAPAHRLAELRIEGVDDDKRTVARKAVQAVPAGAPPASTATPFDVGLGALYDWSGNGGKESFAAALEIMGDVVVPLAPEEIVGAMASLLRMTVQVEFDDPDARFLTGFGVQTLALDYLRETDFRRDTRPVDAADAGDESLAWATWLLEQRRDESRQTTESYEAVLALALLLLRRRPKPGYTVGRIVAAAQSLWIGGMHRAFLLPEQYPEYGPSAPPARLSPVTGLPEGDGPIELGMVDLIMGMTEESLFAVNQVSLESRIVVVGLQRYHSSPGAVDVGGLIQEIGADSKLVRDRFPTDQALASACLQWLAGEWGEFGAFARLFRHAAVAGIEALLEWVGTVRRDFPSLLESAGFAPGDPAFDEIMAFIAVVLSRTTFGASRTVGPDDVRRARRCVEAAAGGGPWRDIAGLPPRRADGTHAPEPAG